MTNINAPKEISAVQRLAASNLADDIEELLAHPNAGRGYGNVLLESAMKMLREIAR